MEIIRAKHMGFCFGVLEAINVCNSLVEEKGRKYILGMLVHNKQVVEDMQRKGFKLVTEDELLEDMDELKEGDIVVIRAHGTSKSVHEKLKERKVKVFDATCIFVNKIRQEIEIANENGIYVNGGGFINVNRAALVTGKINIQDGDVVSFTTRDGKVIIGEKGLDISNVERVDIITRTQELTGKIVGQKDVNIILGLLWYNKVVTITSK